ncbi:efflux RND transporter periplasmic adaptor subunit [Roseovarius atlanticus]|uniref:efflux RND transporter periplasmic adaptor subunit n=1 Tax=Roseovarius atlanticus TaxID=1641875 RepID=UPI001C98A10D|nr:HlyD family efflux transporter periplasmic adaptor subunit [Roseovarius atlanticus]MBY5986541.1 HlyD family efflux transporter periplasmic adaptor subunit [Roseovarius atlanticus]MBY6125181.1 HlyD family efflux transporter periplasmic adaptor subunit [Roseovarius atlanticus]MBY6150358.1 HlyD family efflux transporter periplasmic adaptor subunit [Roseovarius atlanticus]
MRFLRHSLTGLFLLSLTVGLFAYAGQIVFSAVQQRMSAETQAPERRERVFAVNTVTAEPGTQTPILTAYGEVESRRTLEIRSDTSGRVTELTALFEDGGRVRDGQVLARIDPTDAQFALDLARADLTDAEAEVREAERGLNLARDELAAAQSQAELRKRALDRQLDLEERGVGTAAAVELAELDAASAEQAVLTRRQAEATAEARVDQAQTRLSRSRIALAEAQKTLDETTITAPFTGTLQAVSVVEGRLVSANEKLADLIDTTALDVAFRVSTAQHRRLLDENGDLILAPVRIRLDVFGLEMETTGRITRDSAGVEEGQTGRLVYARIDDPQGLKPRDFVSVLIEEPPLDNIVRLPATALGSDGTVLALTTEERLRAVPVTLVRRQGNDILVAGDGLDGLEIVTERSPLLGPGLKVRPLGTSPEAEETAQMLELSEDRRARLRQFVENSPDIPAAMKTRLLGQLELPEVPAQTVERLERRMGS